MAAVPRKPQKPLALDSARGILCSSAPGKLYGRTLRAAAIPALVAEASGFKFGGVPGGVTDFPAVAIQMLPDGAARRRRAIAVIFRDVEGALYNILPELGLGPLAGAEQRQSRDGFRGGGRPVRGHPQRGHHHGQAWRLRGLEDCPCGLA